MSPEGQHRSGNYGRWNFSGGSEGPDAPTPPPISTGVGAVISLPGAGDQATHADAEVSERASLLEDERTRYEMKVCEMATKDIINIMANPNSFRTFFALRSIFSTTLTSPGTTTTSSPAESSRRMAWGSPASSRERTNSKSASE